MPVSFSFLTEDFISPTTVYFNLMVFVCSCCGVPFSFLLLYGLYMNHKILLIPWITVVISSIIIDVAHTLYLFSVIPNFNPTTAMFHTLSFFILCTNIYALLCVISQYQEYLAGRGTAGDDYVYRGPVIRYVTQPATTTATTSCLSSRKGTTNNETKATPTQSPTACHNPPLSEKSPSGDRLSRKHVQFPDTSTSSNQIQRPEMPTTEGPTKGKLSKIERNNVRTWLQPNDAITIVVNQSSPSSDEEHVHDCS
ncbi:uncharacterized protein LOC113563559 isoform X3 [Ooceraea biroi]|nr:uncharacterized protein LOC105286759 isoform X3 [Ooceraea biroi]XP_026831018.1 uncharacterized protein LOC113563559 isoform X3 [Ooceraea biroi]